MAQIIPVPNQIGEISERSSEKNPFGSFEELTGVRSRDGELETIGGSDLLDTINAESSGLKIEFETRIFHFYVREDPDDGDTLKTFIAEETAGVIVDVLYNSTEMHIDGTRFPSYAIAPDALFITTGTTIHKFIIDNGDPLGTFVEDTALIGVSNATAICFGQNRIFALEGKTIRFTDIQAGGDVTTFTEGTGLWEEPGRFATEFTEDGTNICYVSGKVVAFSRNRIEIKQLEKGQETISGDTISVHQYVNYADYSKIGTSTYRELPIHGDTVLFVDEDSKRWYFLVPERDQDGRIVVQQIRLDRKNFEKFTYDRYTGIYSTVLNAYLLSCQDEESSINNIVFLIDIDQGENMISRRRWSVSSFCETSNGDLDFNSDSTGECFRYRNDTFTTDNGVKSDVEIVFNDITDPEFWKKLRIKRLAFWFRMNPDAEITFYKSVDGETWTEVEMNLEPEGKGGSLISPYSIYGNTPWGMANQEVSDSIIDYIAGKVKVKSKGTKVKYKIIVSSEYLFMLKSWAITNYKTSGKRKKASLRINP